MAGFSATGGVPHLVQAPVDAATAVKTLLDYWQSIQDAPADFRSITEDLAYLLALLSGTSLQGSITITADSSISAVLESCTNKVKNLVALTEDLEPGFSSASKWGRQWSAMKFVFREAKIKKFRQSLEETKSTVVLAHQMALDRMIRQQFELQRRDLENLSKEILLLGIVESSETLVTSSFHTNELSDHLVNLREDVKQIGEAIASQVKGSGSSKIKEKPPTAVLKPAKYRKRLCSYNRCQVRGALGEVFIWSKTYETSELEPVVKRPNDNRRYETDTQIIIRPSPLIARYGPNRGINFAFQKTRYDKLHADFSTFRAVPDNALIFDFSRTGNIKGIQTLISRGEASVRDTNSDGFTPLHFAAYHGHPELCKVLIREGADEEAVTYRCKGTFYPTRSPMLMASTYCRDIAIEPTDRIDAIRLFMHTADVLDDFSDGWELLLAILSEEWHHRTSGDLPVSAWILRFYSLELRNNPSPYRLAWLMIILLQAGNEQLMQILLDAGADINSAMFDSYGFSPLSGIIAEGLPPTVEPLLELMIMHGQNLHLVGRTCGYGVIGMSPPETPTSVAMRRSQTFSRWQRFLHGVGCDFAELAKREMETSPLASAGWTYETLLFLLNFSFEPASLRKAFCICGREVHQLYTVQEDWWISLLLRIQRGECVDDEAAVTERPLFQESANLCWCCSQNGMVLGGEWSPNAKLTRDKKARRAS